MEALAGLASVKEAALFGKTLHLVADDGRSRGRGDPPPAGRAGLRRRADRADRAFAGRRLRVAHRSPRPRRAAPRGGAAMNAQRVAAVARKEFLHVLRDPRSLGMAIAIPMLMLLLFGFALTLDVDHVPLVVWDQNRTPDSRELVSKFAGSPYFSLRPLCRQRARHGSGDRFGRGPDGADHPLRLRPADGAPARGPAGRGHLGRRFEYGHHRPGLCRRDRANLFAGVVDPAIRPARPGEDQHAAGCPRPSLVQRRTGVEELYRAGPDRRDHDGHHRHAHLAHFRPRVGTGHHGAAHFHAGARARNWCWASSFPTS